MQTPSGIVYSKRADFDAGWKDYFNGVKNPDNAADSRIYEQGYRAASKFDDDLTHALIDID